LSQNTSNQKTADLGNYYGILKRNNQLVSITGTAANTLQKWAWLSRIQALEKRLCETAGCTTANLILNKNKTPFLRVAKTNVKHAKLYTKTRF
jgi:hypothetical protein